MKIAETRGCPAAPVGWVKGNRLRIGFDRGVIPIDIEVADLKAAWEDAIPSIMAGDTASAAEIDALPEANQPIN